MRARFTRSILNLFAGIWYLTKNLYENSSISNTIDQVERTNEPIMRINDWWDEAGWNLSQFNASRDYTNPRFPRYRSKIQTFHRTSAHFSFRRTGAATQRTDIFVNHLAAMFAHRLRRDAEL